MAKLFYVSHPQVKIDPFVPVPEWGLSDVGRARAQSAAQASRLRNVRRIVSSSERKAIETAEIFGEVLGVAVEVRDGLHENDRSATGYMPPEEFEMLANQFFAFPDQSVRGWERASDAQARIVAGVAGLGPSDGDVLMAGHGGVGTLLYCHFARRPIARVLDQKPGGGSYFVIDIAEQRALHGWTAIEEM
jgi:broad specificity phosphatase PhoE